MTRPVNFDDLPMILHWLEARRLYNIKPHHLGANGLITNECMAGFVYKDPSSTLAYLDNVIAAPGRKPSSSTASELARELGKKAKAMGAEYVLGFTATPGVANICSKRLRLQVVCGLLVHGEV